MSAELAKAGIPDRRPRQRRSLAVRIDGTRWVPLYAFAYRCCMKALHFFGAHWFKDTRPMDSDTREADHVRWCQWCGARRTLEEGE